MKLGFKMKAKLLLLILAFHPLTGHSYYNPIVVSSCKEEILKNRELCNFKTKSSIELKGEHLIPVQLIREIADSCRSDDKIISALLIKQKINELYACSGYINSGALIKKNNLDEYYLEVIQGQLSDENIIITDIDKRSHQYIIHSLMDGNKSKPLNINDIRARLELLKKSSLFKTINATIAPIKDRIDQVKVNISVKRNNPYKWAITLDNQQSKSSGAEQFLYTGKKQAIMTLFDSVGATIQISEGNKGLGIFYNYPLNEYTSWGVSLDAKESAIITKPLEKLNITSSYQKLGIDHSRLLYDNLDTNNKINNSQKLQWQSKLEVIRTSNHLLDRAFSFSNGENEGETSITSLQSNLVWERKQRSDIKNFALSASLGLDVGLNAFGSTPSSENSAGSNYKILKASLGYRQTLAEHGNLKLNLNGQYSNDLLLATKKVGLGGVGSVRGAEKNITSFDSSIAFSAESTLLLPSLSGTPFVVDSTVNGNFYISTFTDYAYGKDNSTGKENGLGSFGVGLTWFPTKNTKFNLSYGKPISFSGFTDEQIKLLDDGMVNFNLTVSGKN